MIINVCDIADQLLCILVLINRPLLFPPYLNSSTATLRSLITPICLRAQCILLQLIQVEAWDHSASCLNSSNSKLQAQASVPWLAFLCPHPALFLMCQAASPPLFQASAARARYPGYRAAGRAPVANACPARAA